MVQLTSQVIALKKEPLAVWQHCKKLVSVNENGLARCERVPRQLICDKGWALNFMI